MIFFRLERSTSSLAEAVAIANSVRGPASIGPVMVGRYGLDFWIAEPVGGRTVMLGRPGRWGSLSDHRRGPNSFYADVVEVGRADVAGIEREYGIPADEPYWVLIWSGFGERMTETAFRLSP